MEKMEILKIAKQIDALFYANEVGVPEMAEVLCFLIGKILAVEVTSDLLDDAVQAISKDIKGHYRTISDILKVMDNKEIIKNSRTDLYAN